MSIPVGYAYANGQADAVATTGTAEKKSSLGNTDLLQLFAIGIPIAAAVGVFGWRSRRKSKDEK
jgi:hypothetical protein